MSKSLTMYIDGACQGNPGPAGVGVLVTTHKKVIAEISEYIGETTNNVAEYTSLIYGLQEALIRKAETAKVFTDSELLFRQMSGDYKIKNGALKVLARQVQHLRKGFKDLSLQYIPRGENKRADQLATEAIQRARGRMVAPL